MEITTQHPNELIKNGDLLLNEGEEADEDMKENQDKLL